MEGTTEARTTLRVANMSGFFGDRFSAAEEMVRGGPIDVLTGDYLSEITMTILHRKRSKRPGEGYVPTFLRQMERVLGECLDRKIRVVSNAGGLDPKRLAEELAEVARKLGLSPKIAYIDGDDILPRLGELRGKGERFENLEHPGRLLDPEREQVVVANAYLGGWGIREALARGADVVVCPRVTDAALVVGPAAWAFDWKRDEWDKLAGAVVAGHVLECGAQATGGNYAFFEEVPSFENIGFPIAEMHADGSFVVTKHPRTGGLVSVGTVTAQLLYEIHGPRYLNADVVARFDSLRVEQQGPDRVLVAGARGEAPPQTLKATIHCLAGYRNTVTVVLSGRKVDEKAALVEAAVKSALGDDPPTFAAELVDRRPDEPTTNDEALAFLRIGVLDRDAGKVGRRFSSRLTELALSSVPGFTLTAPPGDASPLYAYWPALVDRRHIEERVHVGGEVVLVPPPPELGPTEVPPPRSALRAVRAFGAGRAWVRFGQIFGARSGDKGQDATLGVWARSDEAFDFLRDWLSVDRLRELLPDVQAEVLRCELPNLRAVHFVLRGLLDDTHPLPRTDPQAKTLAEYLRARTIAMPVELVVGRSSPEP